MLTTIDEGKFDDLTMFSQVFPHYTVILTEKLLLFHFSVNKISSMSDFEECPNLQELYLRKNNIQDINDLAFLQVRSSRSIGDLPTGNVNGLKIMSKFTSSVNTHFSKLRSHFLRFPPFTSFRMT